MDQNVSVDNDLQKAIDDITQNTNADPVFSDPVAAPSSVPEGDSGELAAPVGPFPAPEPMIPEVPMMETPVAPEAPVAPEPIADAPAVEQAPVATDNLNIKQVKEAALRDLVPLLDRLPLNASQKFEIYRDTIEELHDFSAVEPAYRAASEITDETEKAEALLYLVESIDKM